MEVSAFIEPLSGGQLEQLEGVPVRADWATLGRGRFIVAIGANDVRERAFAQALTAGGEPVALVHPRAALLGGAVIGNGSHVAAGAIVGVGSRIGVNVIVNTGAIIDHDCLVADHAFIAPGSALAGRVRVGVGAHIGLGALVLEGREVGPRAYVAAGATVIRDVPDGVRVAGVPARQMNGEGAL
jgi:sugar O-acyltransferase (sialic acid O-acetyltransferase NeuD family)